MKVRFLLVILIFSAGCIYPAPARFVSTEVTPIMIEGQAHPRALAIDFEISPGPVDPDYCVLVQAFSSEDAVELMFWRRYRSLLDLRSVVVSLEEGQEVFVIGHGQRKKIWPPDSAESD